MSQPMQYPQQPMYPGYPVPGYGPDLLAPARRAAIMLLVLGILGVLAGGCLGVGLQTLSSADLDKIRQQMPPNAGMTVEMIRIVFVVMCTILALVGVVFLVLALFVRKGGIIACTLALVVVGLCCLLLLLNVVGSLVNGQPQGLPIGLGLLAAMTVLIRWLIQAIGNSSKVAMMRHAQPMGYPYAPYPYPPNPYAPQAYGQPMYPVPPGYPQQTQPPHNPPPTSGQ